jgi:hypothetical protein
VLSLKVGNIPILILDQARGVIAPVLQRELGADGFAGLNVRVADDHDGDPSTYVDVEFAEGHRAIPVTVSLDAANRAQAALRAFGDERFAYIWFNVRVPSGSSLERPFDVEKFVRLAERAIIALSAMNPVAQKHLVAALVARKR